MTSSSPKSAVPVAGGQSEFEHEPHWPQGAEGGQRLRSRHQKLMIKPQSLLQAPCSLWRPLRFQTTRTWPPPEVGVYWKKTANAFALIQGQAISQSKVGGKAGSFFTYGMRNEHWGCNPEWDQPRANTINDRQPIFYLYVPEGSSASDYSPDQNLKKKGNHREFRSRFPLAASLAAKRESSGNKQVEITAEHVGIRTYKVKLAQELKPRRIRLLHGHRSAGNHGGAVSGGTARSGGSTAGRVI